MHSKQLIVKAKGAEESCCDTEHQTQGSMQNTTNIRKENRERVCSWNLSEEVKNVYGDAVRGIMKAIEVCTNTRINSKNCHQHKPTLYTKMTLQIYQELLKNVFKCDAKMRTSGKLLRGNKERQNACFHYRRYRRMSDDILICEGRDIKNVKITIKCLVIFPERLYNLRVISSLMGAFECFS